MLPTMPGLLILVTLILSCVDTEAIEAKRKRNMNEMRLLQNYLNDESGDKLENFIQEENPPDSDSEIVRRTTFKLSDLPVLKKWEIPSHSLKRRLDGIVGRKHKDLSKDVKKSSYWELKPDFTANELDWDDDPEKIKLDFNYKSFIDDLGDGGGSVEDNIDGIQQTGTTRDQNNTTTPDNDFNMDIMQQNSNNALQQASTFKSNNKCLACNQTELKELLPSLQPNPKENTSLVQTTENDNDEREIALDSRQNSIHAKVNKSEEKRINSKHTLTSAKENGSNQRGPKGKHYVIETKGNIGNKKRIDSKNNLPASKEKRDGDKRKVSTLHKRKKGSKGNKKHATHLKSTKSTSEKRRRKRGRRKRSIERRLGLRNISKLQRYIIMQQLKRRSKSGRWKIRRRRRKRRRRRRRRSSNDNRNNKRGHHQRVRKATDISITDNIKRTLQEDTAITSDSIPKEHSHHSSQDVERRGVKTININPPQEEFINHYMIPLSAFMVHAEKLKDNAPTTNSKDIKAPAVSRKDVITPAVSRKNAIIAIDDVVESATTTDVINQKITPMRITKSLITSLFPLHPLLPSRNSDSPTGVEKHTVIKHTITPTLSQKLASISWSANTKKNVVHRDKPATVQNISESSGRRSLSNMLDIEKLGTLLQSLEHPKMNIGRLSETIGLKTSNMLNQMSTGVSKIKAKIKEKADRNMNRIGKKHNVERQENKLTNFHQNELLLSSTKKSGIPNIEWKDNAQNISLRSALIPEIRKLDVLGVSKEVINRAITPTPITVVGNIKQQNVLPAHNGKVDTSDATRKTSIRISTPTPVTENAVRKNLLQIKSETLAIPESLKKDTIQTIARRSGLILENIKKQYLLQERNKNSNESSTQKKSIIQSIKTVPTSTQEKVKKQSILQPKQIPLQAENAILHHNALNLSHSMATNLSRRLLKTAFEPIQGLPQTKIAKSLVSILQVSRRNGMRSLVNAFRRHPIASIDMERRSLQEPRLQELNRIHENSQEFNRMHENSRQREANHIERWKHTREGGITDDKHNQVGDLIEDKHWEHLISHIMDNKRSKVNEPTLKKEEVQTLAGRKEMGVHLTTTRRESIVDSVKRQRALQPTVAKRSRQSPVDIIRDSIKTAQPRIVPHDLKRRNGQELHDSRPNIPSQPSPNNGEESKLINDKEEAKNVARDNIGGMSQTNMQHAMGHRSHIDIDRIVKLAIAHPSFRNMLVTTADKLDETKSGISRQENQRSKTPISEEQFLQTETPKEVNSPESKRENIQQNSQFHPGSDLRSSILPSVERTKGSEEPHSDADIGRNGDTALQERKKQGIVHYQLDKDTNDTGKSEERAVSEESKSRKVQYFNLNSDSSIGTAKQAELPKDIPQVTRRQNIEHANADVGIDPDRIGKAVSIAMNQLKRDKMWGEVFVRVHPSGKIRVMIEETKKMVQNE